MTDVLPTGKGQITDIIFKVDQHLHKIVNSRYLDHFPNVHAKLFITHIC